MHLEANQSDSEALSWENPLEDDEDEADDGEDDGGDFKPPPQPPKPRKSAQAAKSATDKKGGRKPTGKGNAKQPPEEVVVDDDDDNEDGDADGDSPELSYDHDRKEWRQKKELKDKPRRKRPKPQPPNLPKPEPKAEPPGVKQKPKRAKDHGKYARNVELGGFHVDPDKAELVEADGNKFTAGQITRRSNFVDGLEAHDHFAHLDLFGSGSGDLKNCALIFIHPDERQWLSKELCLCDHDSTTAAGEKGMCSLCAVRCKVIAIFGVPVTAMDVGDTLYVKYQVSRHVSYHVSCPTTCPTTPRTAPADNCLTEPRVVVTTGAQHQARVHGSLGEGYQT